MWIYSFISKKKEIVDYEWRGFCVFAALEDDEGKGSDGISFSSSTGPAWAGSERDYTYDEVGKLYTCPPVVC